MEKDQKISLRIVVLGLLCASLSFVFGSASVSAATYTNKYTEDFSTTTYKDSDKTTLNWSTNTKDLYLPWDYAKKVTSGTAVSKKINMSSDFVTGARLTDLSTFQEGSAGKSFYLSNDGGKTWLAVSSGKDISFVSTGNDLRWKIVLNNTYFPGAVSVTVGGLTVSYTTTNASLNIALAGKTITAKKGDKGVELETLNFISKGSQSILLHNLVFRATSGTASATKALDAVYLYKGSTQVAKATLNSENNFKFDSSFTIPANSSLSLTIKGDISSTTALSSLILDLSSYNVGYSNTSDDVESYFSGTSSVVKISDNTTSPIAKYTLIVANGTGSGSYASGTKVAISATSGKVFDKWTGDTKYVADVNSAGTTVTMPAQAITVTATYKAASSPIRWCSWHTNIDPDRISTKLGRSDGYNIFSLADEE